MLLFKLRDDNKFIIIIIYHCFLLFLLNELKLSVFILVITTYLKYITISYLIVKLSLLFIKIK
jgi:hypothetical protein